MPSPAVETIAQGAKWLTACRIGSIMSFGCECWRCLRQGHSGFGIRMRLQSNSVFLQAMQKKLAALIAAGGPHLADLAYEYDSITASPHNAADQRQLWKLPTADGITHPSSTAAATDGSSICNEGAVSTMKDVDTSRQAYLNQALEDAESTVALLQQRLVEATQQQQLATRRLQDMQDRAAAAAVRHTQQLAAAKQAGQAQLTALQEVVGRLSNRSELAGQVSALPAHTKCNLHL